ncbi:hypothetical protein DID88_007544 [Monilinia fructigena]|uniref:Uncharacterized protein n=1 Tax=Monilinia fructigena TaxID=38457 RepID=A0A395J354_9HELO|nr:hypothetical protein DID88_007544 [Monilinia fructigena]
MDLHPSTTIAFTTTVTTTQISGTPNPAAVHCGLHGLPVGDFFLAEFVEDKAGVDVSLRGCWEFCRGVYGIDKGCVSYSFYPEPGTGAPRCDLFGGVWRRVWIVLLRRFRMFGLIWSVGIRLWFEVWGWERKGIKGEKGGKGGREIIL